MMPFSTGIWTTKGRYFFCASLLFTCIVIIEKGQIRLLLWMAHAKNIVIKSPKLIWLLLDEYVTCQGREKGVMFERWSCVITFWLRLDHFLVWSQQHKLMNSQMSNCRERGPSIISLFVFGDLRWLMRDMMKVVYSVSQ